MYPIYLQYLTKKEKEEIQFNINPQCAVN